MNKKKLLNVDHIANELAGGSAFFPSYQAPLPQAPVAPATPLSPTPPAVSEKEPAEEVKLPTEEPKSLPPERPNARTVQRPSGKRIITRNSFEIYEDQMDSLRKLSYHEKMEGKLGSMSGMVREAIDNYLQKRSAGQ